MGTGIQIDLANANGTLTVLTNNGSGGLGFNAALDSYGTPDCLVLTNIYGSSLPDLICANNNGELLVFQNTGPGGFEPFASYGVGSGAEYVIAADVNGDGHPDLITANYANNSLTVLTNDGTGNFPLFTTYAVGTNPVGVAAADLNGDGKVDLVCANYTSKSLTVLTNNGHGVRFQCHDQPVRLPDFAGVARPQQRRQAGFGGHGVGAGQRHPGVHQQWQRAFWLQHHHQPGHPRFRGDGQCHRHDPEICPSRPTILRWAD